MKKNLFQKITGIGFFTGKTSHSEKSIAESIQYDPEKQYPVIRASICTGEKVAGFKDKNGSHFTEVTVIRTPEDLEKFKAAYNLDHIKTEY